MYRNVMKDLIYKYPLKTGHLDEAEAVHFAYTNAGWIFVEMQPEIGLPTHMVFKWPKDCAAYYPDVNET